MLLGENFTQTLKIWVDDFQQNSAREVDNWLGTKLQEALGSSEGLSAKGEITEGVATYEKNKRDIIEAYENGKSKEEWLADKLQTATSDLQKEEQTKVLAAVHKGLTDAIGIETEENTEEENSSYELTGSMVAKSVGELTTARVMQVFGEETEPEEILEGDVEDSAFIEESLNNNTDGELKKIASGVLTVLVKGGRIPFIPATAPVKVITQIACFGVDHAKTIMQIAKKEISLTEGLRIIARDAISTMFGILSNSDGKMDGDSILGRIPFLQKPLQYVNKISDAVLQFVGGEELKEKVKAVKQRIAPVARDFVRSFVHETVSVVRSVATKIANFLFG